MDRSEEDRDVSDEGKRVMNDYRCPKGHISAAPDAEHGGPWSTLVCPYPNCGATALLETYMGEPSGRLTRERDAEVGELLSTKEIQMPAEQEERAITSCDDCGKHLASLDEGLRSIGIATARCVWITNFGGTERYYPESRVQELEGERDENREASHRGTKPAKWELIAENGCQTRRHGIVPKPPSLA
jgi:hypothetical protein